MSHTDHPRRPGTHRYASRAWRDDLDYPGETDMPHLNTADAIAEGLEEYVETLYVEGPAPECDNVTWDDWGWLEPIVAVEDEDEEIRYGDPAEPAGDEETDRTPWPPTLTYEQACEELAYGFTVEGPSARPEPLVEGRYVRVYQLARDLGVDSAPLVRYLRNAGEYVATHQSWVALPVADRLLAEKDAIVLALGERTTPTLNPFRRPAPRPGNNPFNAPNLLQTRVR